MKENGSSDEFVRRKARDNRKGELVKIMSIDVAAGVKGASRAELSAIGHFTSRDGFASHAG